MYCALSGQIAEHPVVSRKSGHVFERRLVEKYVEANQKCPITGEPMTLEDLVDLQVSHSATKPRPQSSSSVPGMLSLFQNEWDSLMLETYTLKQQLDSVRQELSQALYQHDAACRVIARLIQERDGARTQLAEYEARGGSAAAKKGEKAGDAMDVEDQQAPAAPEGLPRTVVQEISAKSQELSKERKKRKVSPTLATVDEIKGFKATTTHTLHSASQPGISCLDISSQNDKIIATGGRDGSGLIFDRVAGQVLATLSGHSKAVTDICLHPDLPVCFTSSEDSTVRVWRDGGNGEWNSAHTFEAHSDSVVGISLHPVRHLLAAASTDATWSCMDIDTGAVYEKVSYPDNGIKYSSLKFHPDGQIMGTGTQHGQIFIWDVKSQKCVKTFDACNGSVSAISFSENGYYMGFGGSDGSLQIYDLRHLSKPARVLISPSDGFVPESVAFDHSGVYLAAAGVGGLRVHQAKSGDVVQNWEGSHLTGVAFGNDSRFIATSGMDRLLSLYA